jgi:hypothetical protein
MAATDIELLSQCADFTLFHANEAEKKIIEELQTCAATRLVSGLRMLRLQKAVLAIGMFSLFESLLQDRMNWKNPFEELEKYLKGYKQDALARTFDNYVLAINVLKHGEGRSYNLLLERLPELDFTVKAKDQSFFFEGDVSEVSVLIDANDAFVKRCATLIQEIAAVLRSNEKTWI